VSDGEPAEAAPGPAPAPLPAPPGPPPGGSALFTWGTGASILAGCVDLLVGVLLALGDRVSGEAGRFTAHDLGLCTGLAALLSFGLAGLAWRGRPRDSAAAAAAHALLAAAAWFAIGKAWGGLPRIFLATVGVHGLAAGAALVAAVGVPAAAGPAEEERRRARSRDAALGGAENLESILVAIVFALVIRHFAVEAYKIPTHSMVPTLYGDSPAWGTGDRVLVAKWPALLWGPGRWEIWVFRPPENRTINYVKRAVGLGGESVEIRDGDVFVDGKVARKEGRVREETWFPVKPRERRGGPPGPPWQGAGFRREGEDGFRVEGAAEPRLLEYAEAVRDVGMGGAEGTGNSVVGDLRVRFEVEGAEPGTVLLARITGRGGPCEARVAADGSSASTTCGGKAGAGAAPGAPVRELEVSFADLLFEVKADGKVLASREVEPLAADPRPRFGVAFGVERGGALFREVRLDRDVHYTGSHRFEVPEGQVLFLGDNSGNSEDGRRWNAYEIREKGPGGRVFLSKERPWGRGRDGTVTFRDTSGVTRTCREDGIEVSDRALPVSFVPQADLHGRAFAIFWPPRWFTKQPGGRVGILP
jgi:signal peptidase I